MELNKKIIVHFKVSRRLFKLHPIHSFSSKYTLNYASGIYVKYSKIKVNLSLCLTKHHAMKTY
jgi:hypothetical protein